MAEREEIIRIKLDSEQFKTQMIAREKEINNTKEAIKLLNYEIAKEGKATEKQLKQKVELEATQRNLNKEQQNSKRILDASIKSQEAASGSIVGMRAELALLTDKWNNLSAEERENSEVGKNLQKETKNLSDKLKEQEGAIGDNRRSVGSYTEAINQAISGNATFGDGIQKIQQAFEIAKQVGEAFTGSVKEDVKALFAKKAATEAATTATEGQTAATVASNIGMQGARKSAIALNLSLKALGIGLVIAAIAGLLSYFSRFEEGTERLEQLTSGLGAAFGVLIGKIGNFGKAIIDAVSSPLESIKKLNDALILAVTNPLQAFEKLKTGFQDMVESNSKLAGEMARAAVTAANLTRRTQELEDQQNASLATNEALRGQIDRLILQSKERTLSEEQRLAGLQKAGKIEEKLLEKRLDFALEEYNISQRRDELDRASGSLAEEHSQRTLEAQQKVVQIQNESFQIQQQIRNRESGLILEIEKEREEKAKAAEERLTNSLRAAIELRVLQAGEGTRKELKEREKLINFERDVALKEVGLTQNEKKLIIAKSQNEILKLTTEFTQKLIDEEKKQADAFIARTQKEFSEATKASDDYFKQRRLDISNDYANGLTDRETYNKQLKDLESEQLNQNIQVARDYGQSTVDLEQEASNRRIAIRQHEMTEKQKYMRAEYEGAVTITESLMALNSLLAGQNAESTDFAKAVTLVQIGIDTAAAISTILQGAAKAGTEVTKVSGPAGVAAGPLASAAFYAAQATIILKGFAQARELLTAETPRPSFFGGGFDDEYGYTTKGDPHKTASNLGQKRYTYHQSEYIAPSFVLQDPEGAYLVQQLEKLRLSKKRFSANYPGFYNGGFDSVPESTRVYMAGTSTNQIDYNKLAWAMSKQPVIAKIQEIQAVQENIIYREVKTNS